MIVITYNHDIMLQATAPKRRKSQDSDLAEDSAGSCSQNISEPENWVPGKVEALHFILIT